jgi:molecular chaperone GrpE (heat shock protein)
MGSQFLGGDLIEPDRAAGEQSRDIDRPTTERGDVPSLDHASIPTGDFRDLQRMILGGVESLASHVSSIEHLVQERLRYDKTKDEAFEHLYGELDQVKRNTAFEAVRPLYMDLILLYDRIDNARRDLQERSGAEVSQFLGSIADELLEVLCRREVEVMDGSPSIFDATLQRAIGSEPTLVEAEHNQVCRIVRRGFRHGGRMILRPEEVVVKRHVTTASVGSKGVEEVLP